MGRPKRDIRAAAEESTTPPDVLAPGQTLARVLRAEGNSVYSCALPAPASPSKAAENEEEERGEEAGVVRAELASRFRNTIWIRRGGFVLVALTLPREEARRNRVDGEIVNVVRDEKAWRKMGYWPKEFAKSTAVLDGDEDEDSSEEESTVGKMPPSDSEDDE